MRKRLIEFASDLGVNDTTTDIYPAQDEVDLTPEDWNKKRKGNFVNLPYQKSHMTTRVAMDNEGNSIKLENLYKFVSDYRLTPAEFKKLKNMYYKIHYIFSIGLGLSWTPFPGPPACLPVKSHI